MHWQVFLPISFGNVGLISFEIIMLTTYLGSWALIALIITLRFLVNFRLFLLEAIRVGNSSSLLFQTHLRLVRKLLPMVATLCIPPLWTTCREGCTSISKKHFKVIAQPFLFQHPFWLVLGFTSCIFEFLCRVKNGHLVVYPHNHHFFLFGFECFLLCEVHHVGPPPFVGPWLVTLHFWPTFRPQGIHLLHCIHGGERIVFHDAHVGCLSIHCKRCRFSCCTWLDPHSSSTYPLILMSMGWHCAFILWHSHVGRCCHCWPHYTRLGFVCYIVSWGGHDNGGSKKRISSRSI